MYKIAGLLATLTVLAMTVAACAGEAVDAQAVIENACGGGVLDNYDYVSTQWTTGDGSTDPTLVYKGWVGDHYNWELFTYNESGEHLLRHTIDIFDLGLFSRSAQLPKSDLIVDLSSSSRRRGVTTGGPLGEWSADYYSGESLAHRKQIIEQGKETTVRENVFCNFIDLENLKYEGEEELDGKTMKKFTAITQKQFIQTGSKEDYKDLTFWIDSGGKPYRLYTVEHIFFPGSPETLLHSNTLFSGFGERNEITAPIEKPAELDE